MRKSLFNIFILICVGIGLILTLVLWFDPKRTNKSGEEQVKEFTAFFAVQGTEIDDHNDISKVIAEKTNCKVKETWLQGESVERAIGRMIEDDEYPDFIDAGEMSSVLYEKGALMPLDEYIEKYPNIKNYLSEDQWNELRQSDGHIYWIPQFSSFYGEEKGCVHTEEAFWIQTKVLKWAGYPQIRTMDQYFDLIDDYYNANPTLSDGTPVIPYTILCDDWKYYCLENAPAFLDGYPNDGSVIVDPTTNTIIDYNTTETAKKYFKRLNEEYKKGIVDPDSFTQSYDQYIEKLSSGRVLGMIDQWWDFAYVAEDAFKAKGLDKEGCQYVPLPVTISEDVKNQWHCSAHVLHSSSGLAITKSCKDIDGAMKFVNDLLGQEVHNLRFWGIEGVDYKVDNKGMFYRTPEMRVNAYDASYKKAHFCDYSYFPRWNGTSRDGRNAMQPEDQESEFYDTLSDDLKECFDAYGAQTYVDMLGVNDAPGPWYPMYTYSQTMTNATKGGKAWRLMENCKHQYLPRVVMADNFEMAWNIYLKAYSYCKPEDFINEMQIELDRRINK